MNPLSLDNLVNALATEITQPVQGANTYSPTAK